MSAMDLGRQNGVGVRHDPCSLASILCDVISKAHAHKLGASSNAHGVSITLKSGLLFDLP